MLGIRFQAHAHTQHHGRKIRASLSRPSCIVTMFGAGRVVPAVPTEQQTAASCLRTVGGVFSKGSLQNNTFPQTKQCLNHILYPSYYWLIKQLLSSNCSSVSRTSPDLKKHQCIVQHQRACDRILLSCHCSTSPCSSAPHFGACIADPAPGALGQGAVAMGMCLSHVGEGLQPFTSSLEPVWEIHAWAEP